MEEVLGAHTDPDRFAAFLANWETILPQRVGEAVTTISGIRGVRGLILAGSVGRGEAWPLSDIDLLPIYDTNLEPEARREGERRRTEPLDRWVHEGWWTGVDIGNLVFRHEEVVEALDLADDSLIMRLQDNRWYHSIDKGYCARAVYDPTGCAARLATWFTDNRYRPEIVQLRLEREQSEIEFACQRLLESREIPDLLAATKAIIAAVHWLRIFLMERWGERDNSLGRFGTRFERTARVYGQQGLIGQINALSDLDDATAEKRMALAPWWVLERHERQWRARQHVGEDVTRAEDVRDVLRVCWGYGISEVTTPPFPAWLAVPVDLDELDTKIATLSTLVSLCFAG